MDLIQKMYIGDQIADYRLGKGLTQVQLAAIIGVLPSTISRWESAFAMPSVQMLVKLSEILDKPFTIGPKPFLPGKN